MIKIYHNPRCTKSRQALAVIENSNKDFEVIKYLDDPLSKEELENIITKLDIKPIELVRKNEAIWKENYKNKNLTDDEVMMAMVENPKLIERPIVIDGNNAVIGRPTERVVDLLKNS